jgi:hypothetical protein
MCRVCEEEIETIDMRYLEKRARVTLRSPLSRKHKFRKAETSESRKRGGKILKMSKNVASS